MKTRLLFILLCFTLNIFSQNTKYIGKLIDEESNEIIEFANIIEQNSNSKVKTDIEGNFIIQLPQIEEYIFKITALEYNDTIIKVDKKNIENNILLLKITKNYKIKSLNETIITAKLINSSKSSELLLTKASKGLETNISSERISEMGLSNANDVSEKIVGLTSLSSGELFVRGLGDKYNAVYFNGLPISSIDLDKKNISLELIPTNIIDKVSFKKSYMANYNADFSGGLIDITSKTNNKEKTLIFKFGIGINTESFNKDLFTYNGGKTDYLGIEDGTRKIPVEINENTEDKWNSIENKGAIFRNNFNPISKKYSPKNSFGVYYNDLYNFKNKTSVISYIFSMNHSYSEVIEDEKYIMINTQEEEKINYDIKNYIQNTESSILFGVNYIINPKNEINISALGINTSIDKTSEVLGTHWDYTNKISSRTNFFVQNRLSNFNINGSHKKIFKNISLNWNIAQSKAINNKPDNKQLVYICDNDNNYKFNSIDLNENYRQFSSLSSSQYTGNVELKYNMNNIFKKIDLETHIGIFGKYAKKSFNYRRFLYNLRQYNGIVDYNNPDSYFEDTYLKQNKYSIIEKSDLASSNNTREDNISLYLLTVYNISKNLEIIPQIRYENNYQNIIYNDQFNPTKVNMKYIYSIDLLPSIAIKYKLNEKNIIRINNSKTVLRPNYREITPYMYLDMFAGLSTIGNPNLVNGSTYNIDLKYEFYPKLREIFAITIFYKQLNNPIERTMEVSSSTIQSFRNAKRAEILGTEIEFMKSLSFISKNTKSIFNSLFININISLIKSKIEFDDNIQIAQTDNKRNLQGASPLIANIDLTYDKTLKNNSKFTSNISYNITGKRLYNVGTYGLGNIYEMPRHNLNFISSYSLKHISFSMKVTNLLNQRINIQQEISDNKMKDIKIVKYGQNIEFEIKYKF